MACRAMSASSSLGRSRGIERRRCDGATDGRTRTVPAGQFLPVRGTKPFRQQPIASIRLTLRPLSRVALCITAELPVFCVIFVAGPATASVPAAATGGMMLRSCAHRTRPGSSRPVIAYHDARQWHEACRPWTLHPHPHLEIVHPEIVEGTGRTSQVSHPVVCRDRAQSCCTKACNL